MVPVTPILVAICLVTLLGLKVLAHFSLLLGFLGIVPVVCFSYLRKLLESPDQRVFAKSL